MHEQQHLMPEPRLVVPQYREPDQLETALAALDDLHELPPAEHVARFEAAHTALVAALSAIDKD